MKVDLSKASHVLFFVVFLPALSFGLGWVWTLKFPNLPFWIEGVSPLGAYALLFAFFDKAAWRWPVFRMLGIVTAPDLRGRWEGEQISSFKKNGKPVRSHMVLEVEQTFSSVSASTYYLRWSNTHAACCFLEQGKLLYLMIIFESEPSLHYDGEGKPNKGVGRMRYLRQEKMIMGTYFNTSGNHGEFKLKRTSKQLLHRFAE